jgi:hypothetical protein
MRTSLSGNRRGSRRLAALTLTALLGGLAVLGAGGAARADIAAGVWMPAGNVAAAGRPSLAVDGRGDAFVAYSLQDVGEPGARVHVVEHAAGGGTDLIDLGTVSDPAANSLEPRIAADAAGDLLVAWYAAGDIWAATRPAGGSFGAPIDVSGSDGLVDPISTVGPTLALAMDAAGDAALAWPRWTDDKFEDVALAAAVRPAGGSFGVPRTLISPGVGPAGAGGLSAAIGGGRAVFGYASRNHSFTSTWPLAGSPSGPQMVSSLGGLACEPALDAQTTCGSALVAAAADGRAIAAWIAAERDGSGSHLEVASAAPDGSFAGAQTLASRGTGQSLGSEFDLAFGQGGDAAVAWTAVTLSSGTHTAIEVARRGPTASSFGPAIDAGAADGSLAPRIALDAAGDAVAIWKSPAGPGTYDVDGALLAAGAGSFAAPEEVGTSGVQEPAARLAATPGGDAATAFVWPSSNGVGGVGVGLAGFDGAGPQLSGLGPETAVAGADTVFHADASDAWSTLTGVTWDFGDGGTATGTAPHHVFAAPGSYSVSVTATDAVGQSKRAGFTVTVTAPGGGGGPGGGGPEPGNGEPGGGGGSEPGGGEPGGGPSDPGGESGPSGANPPSAGAPGGQAPGSTSTGGGEASRPRTGAKKRKKCHKGRKLKHGKCVKPAHRKRHGKPRR